MKLTSTQRLALSSFFLALALVLPLLTGQLAELGQALLPMHLPILICGFICGWRYGLLTGLIAPILRSLLFGMPPMIPVAVAMSIELGAYGLLTGLLSSYFKKTVPYIYLVLIMAMLIGRIAYGITSALLLSANQGAYSLTVWATGAFVTAVPGIILQLVLIPILVYRLYQLKPEV